MSDESGQIEKPPKSPSIKGDATAKNPPNPPSLTPAQDRPSSNAATQNNHKKLTKWECFERGVKIVECLALIGGVATAVFIGYQWQEMRKASGDAEKALDLTSQQLKAMQTQSYVMQGQLDEMQRTRQFDERAWVTAYDFKPNSTYSLDYFVVTYKNTGKTPAINCDFFIQTTMNWKSIPARDVKPYPPKNSKLLAPDGTGVLDADFMQWVVSRQDVENGLVPIYIYGTIWYDDVFGHHHWSQFNVAVLSRGEERGFEFTSGTNHNSCDDAQTNQTN